MSEENKKNIKKVTEEKNVAAKTKNNSTAKTNRKSSTNSKTTAKNTNSSVKNSAKKTTKKSAAKKNGSGKEGSKKTNSSTKSSSKTGSTTTKKTTKSSSKANSTTKSTKSAGNTKTSTKKNNTPTSKKSSDKKTASKTTSTTKKTTTKSPDKVDVKAVDNKKSATEIASDAAKAAKDGDAPKTFGLKKGKKSKDDKSKFGVGKASKDSLASTQAKREKEVKKADEELKKEREASHGKAPKLVEVDSGKDKKTKTSYKQARKERAEKAVKHKKMKRAAWLFALCIGVFVITLGCFKLAGALVPNGGVAAKVDDYKIMEADVTHYVENNTIYKSYKKQQSTWGSMLSSYFGGAESFRKQIIEDKFVHDELVRRASETENVTVTDQSVNDEISKFKRQYKNENAYKQSLSDSGYTEDTYRDYVYQSLLEKELTNKVTTPKQPSDSDLATFINGKKTSYTGARHSAQIQFDSKDKDKAQSVLDQINSGALSFENAVAQYSTDSVSKAKGGDMGWDKFENYTYNYQHSLSGLDTGNISSELVSDEDGIHIIKCLEIWSPDENATISTLDGIPVSLVDEFREEKIKTDQKTDLETWLDTYKEDNNIEVTIYPMPADVPYNVSSKDNSKSSSTSTSTSTGTDTGTTTDSDNTLTF